MRLIADFQDEKHAYGFHQLLLQENIPSMYEKDSTAGLYRVWIVEEEDADKAKQLHTSYLQNPSLPKAPSLPKEKQPELFYPKNLPRTGPLPWRAKIAITRSLRPNSTGLTTLFIFLCLFLLLWNGGQEQALLEKGGEARVMFVLTPLQQALLFDNPQESQMMGDFLEKNDIRTLKEIHHLPPQEKEEFNKIKEMPTWKGISDLLLNKNFSSFEGLPPGTLFHQIRKGEIWRLFTPCLMHQGILHLLFNMGWFWILGRQIEGRIGKGRFLGLILFTGILANIAQYLISGPIFLGFSGVVVGLVGFIWSRQKIAPWEGYPLERATALFILIFVLVMLGVELVAMALYFFKIIEASIPFGNTAHLVGGIVGMLLGRLPLFSRTVK